MKRVVVPAIVFSGMMFSFFLINLILYMYNPGYHALLEDAVSGKSDIPVVEVRSSEIKANTNISEDSHTLKVEEQEIITASFIEDKEEIPLNQAPNIINKEYHEDCGTGEGYWVITYEDGTVAIE